MPPRNHTAATADLVSPHASFFVDVGRSRAETLIGMPTANSNSYVHVNHSAPAPPPLKPVPLGGGATQGYDFRYSQCNGRRKALLIGINYFSQRGQLRGCIYDVRNMASYLVEHFGYKREDMVILTDDQQNPMSQPTKQNILRAMHWLEKDARSNDSLFLHYSGKSQEQHRLSLSSGIGTLRQIQVTADKPKISMETKKMATTRSFTPSISAKWATSQTTRCTGSW